MSLRSTAKGIGPNFKKVVQECIDYVNHEVGIDVKASVYIEWLPKNEPVQAVHGRYTHYYNKITIQIPNDAFDFTELLAAIAHEYKHHIQFKTGDLMKLVEESETLPYEQRPHEIEALAFGNGIARKWTIENHGK